MFCDYTLQLHYIVLQLHCTVPTILLNQTPADIELYFSGTSIMRTPLVSRCPNFGGGFRYISGRRGNACSCSCATKARSRALPLCAIARKDNQKLELCSPVARIFRRGGSWMSNLYAYKTRGVWGHAPPGNF